MDNTYKNRTPIILTLIFEIIVLITAVTTIFSAKWGDLALCGLAFVCLFLPFIISAILKSKNISLPPSFKLVTVIFIFSAQYLGEIIDFYTMFWWWDLLLHGVFGFYATLTGFYLIKGNFDKGSEATEKRYLLFKIIFAFSLAITLGTLWEIFEYLGDYFLKTSMAAGGLEDTMSDIMIKLVGSTLYSTIYYFSEKS
ncbi:hypothetical protein [Clostridium sp. 'White wine YQ']|uniref:hypothetical protein n=1 Tax=Clostridium sp. 'White wine YQ' TaxID=3027474 RepID=UPI002366FB2C|nr:hypothetical protein [Clostridium sp. 'White wine YQ']MDD7794271.1 hypothetical protein [Clostridium sp. 'White wine YQ']